MKLTSNLKKSNQIFKLFQDIEQAKKGIILCIVKAGNALNEFQNNNNYRKFNEEAKTFMDFVINELKISYSTAYNWMSIAEEFGKLLTSNAVGTSERKLVALLPVVTEENKEEWLFKATNLSDREFYEEVREAKGKKTSKDCEHKEKEQWERCVECKKFLKK